MATKKTKPTTAREAQESKDTARNEQAYAMNETGAKRYAEMLVKIGVAVALIVDRSWLWITIPQEKARAMAMNHPAFRVFFQTFSRKRGAFACTPQTVKQYAERAGEWGVMISPDGKGILDAYDLDTEWGKHNAEQAKLKAAGQPHTYGSMTFVNREKKTPAGKKSDAILAENATLKDTLAQALARIEALEKGKASAK